MVPSRHMSSYVSPMAISLDRDPENVFSIAGCEW